jgi:hypothetical protein
MRKIFAACVVAAFMTGGVADVATAKQPPTQAGSNKKCRDTDANGGVAGPGKKNSVPPCRCVGDSG